MRLQMQEILNERKREKLEKKFYEQKECFDTFKEAKS